MKVVLTVFLAIACLNYPLDSAAYPAASAADDEACRKLNKRILDTIELPASTAFSNEKYMEALSLYRGGLAQWSSAVFKTSPNKDIQATKVAALKKDISRVLRRMGKFDEAAETLLSSINENWVGEFSSNYQTYINAGEIYAEGRLFEKALSSYRKVAEPASPWMIAQAHIRISEMFETEGKMQDAESELLEQLKKLGPKHNPRAVRSVRLALEQLYTREKKLESASALKAALQDKHCPVCGSDADVLPICYGLVVSSPPNVHLGGCMVSPDSPIWWCNKDKIEF